MLVFVEGGKPEKNPQSKVRTNNELISHVAPGWNQTRATLVGSEHSHHCTIPAPPIHWHFHFRNVKVKYPYLVCLVHLACSRSKIKPVIAGFDVRLCLCNALTVTNLKANAS